MSRAKHRALTHSEAVHLIGRATGAGLLTDHINADSFDDGDITIGDNGITVTRWRTEREVKP